MTEEKYLVYYLLTATSWSYTVAEDIDTALDSAHTQLERIDVVAVKVIEQKTGELVFFSRKRRVIDSELFVLSDETGVHKHFPTVTEAVRNLLINIEAEPYSNMIVSFKGDIICNYIGDKLK